MQATASSKNDERSRSKSSAKGGGKKKEYVRKSFGEKKGGKGGLRKNRDQRKKGQSSWKNVNLEVEQLNRRILQETPPSGVLYYKYKPKKEDAEDEDALREEEKAAMLTGNKKRHHPILETNDKTKVKIRFSDLPMSRCTQNGLFKSKFIKMTEV